MESPGICNGLNYVNMALATRTLLLHLDSQILKSPRICNEFSYIEITRATGTLLFHQNRLMLYSFRDLQQVQIYEHDISYNDLAFAPRQSNAVISPGLATS